jgi:hypothetical protein
MWSGSARLVLLVGIVGASGCDALSAHTFAGAIISMTMTLSSQQPEPTGEHLELWARDANNDIIRVDGIVDSSARTSAYGLQVVLAVDPADPCMIVTDKGSPAYGELLVSPKAYPTKVRINGVDQSPAQQAQQVRNRIAQVTAAALGGQQSSSLMAMVAYTDTVNPAAALPTDAPGKDRAAACEQFWRDPLTYTGNPAQLTAPLHGVSYGFTNYVTPSPPSGFDAIRLDTPVNLRGLRELWMTIETVPTAQVKPTERGALFMASTPAPGGGGVVHFDLAGPSGAGAATLYVDLDQDSVQF